MLNKDSILEFQAIIKKEYGKSISFEEAEAQGVNLISLFQILIENNHDKLSKK